MVRAELSTACRRDPHQRSSPPCRDVCAGPASSVVAVSIQVAFGYSRSLPDHGTETAGGSSDIEGIEYRAWHQVRTSIDLYQHTYHVGILTACHGRLCKTLVKDPVLRSSSGYHHPRTLLHLLPALGCSSFIVNRFPGDAAGQDRLKTSERALALKRYRLAKQGANRSKSHADGRPRTLEVRNPAEERLGSATTRETVAPAREWRCIQPGRMWKKCLDSFLETWRKCLRPDGPLSEGCTPTISGEVGEKANFC
jgi:hypothetical protein